MTKAQRIFDKTYQECRLHIKNHGVQKNPDGTVVGFNGMITEETVAVRTLNEIQKMIDREVNNLDRDERLGVLDSERIEYLRNAMKMVQSTKDNSMKHIRELEAWLNQ